MSYNNERITTAVDNASDAFGQSIVESYPEICSGDMSPDKIFALHQAMALAVEQWLESNGGNDE